jgi:hypothetical protein
METQIRSRLTLPRVLALAFFVIISASFGAVYRARTAEAEGGASQGLACPIGMEEAAGLCYEPCPAGFKGAATKCLSICPPGWIDDGFTCRQDTVVTSKLGYDRGAGRPLVCASNQEQQGGLCYPRCAPGYYGVGPVCWQQCKAGYADHGVTCFRHIFDFYGKHTYGRGAGGPLTACPTGMEKQGALCYPRCAPGYTGTLTMCLSICPTGTIDDGLFCRKDIVVTAKVQRDRGVGIPLNVVPVAVDATVIVPLNTDTVLSFGIIDRFESEDFKVIVVERQKHGKLIGNTYTPAAGYEGSDTIVWKTTDGKNESNIAVLTLLVGNVGANTAPVAVDRELSTLEDTPLTFQVTCVDAETPVNELFYNLIEKPAHGEYAWIPPNTVIYTPSADFTGTDSLTFRSHDGITFSNTSRITFNVQAQNDAPLAAAQTLSTTRNASLGIGLFATDAEGDVITYRVVTSPTHGVLTGDAPYLTYTPEPGYAGNDSLIFEARDAQGAVTSAEIAIVVKESNTAPIAGAQTLSVTQDSALGIMLGADDADNDALRFVIVKSPEYGDLSGSGAEWVYLPDAGFVGTDAFTFKVNDGSADSPVVRVEIAVTATPVQGSLIGLVFDDRNKNGQADDGERGVAGLTVTLIGANGQPLKTAQSTAITAQTDANGVWRFDDLPAGQYTVQVSANPFVKLATSLQFGAGIEQRGVTQLGPAAATVTGRGVAIVFVAK